MKKFIVSWFLFIELLLVSFPNAFAASQLKIICDIDGENIYVDGKFKTTCCADDPVLILVPPGKHVIKVKKFNKDGSYYYFKKVVEIGDGVRVTVGVDSEKRYTERYYYNKARKSGEVEDCLEYLEKYPHGKYVKQVKKIMERYYYDKARRTGDPEDCIRYLKKYPHGRYVRKVRSILEDYYYNKAQSSGMAEDYLTYIKKFPNGRYVKQVKEILNSFRSKDWLIEVWSKTFGRWDNDVGLSIYQTDDKGFIVVGYTEKGRDVDMWIIKFNKNGDKVWNKTFKYGRLCAASVVQTLDGNYVVGEVLCGLFYFYTLIVKLDKDGNKIWVKELNDYYDISELPTVDKGFIVVGAQTYNVGGDKETQIIRFSEDGNEVWKKTVRMGTNDFPEKIIKTKDGNYVIVGDSWVHDIDGYVVWMLKIDGNGNEMWKKFYKGKNGYEYHVISAFQTKDGGYVVGGYVYPAEREGNAWIIKKDGDAWIVKFDKNGNKVWEKIWGGSKYDDVTSIVQTEDGGYIVAGNTESKGGEKKRVVWIAKLDKDGNKIWERVLGKEYYNSMSSMIQTKDGEYVICGYTHPYDNKKGDLLIVKLKPIGEEIKNLSQNSLEVLEK